MAAVNQFLCLPTTVTITLADEALKPIAAWEFENAYPVAVEMSTSTPGNETFFMECFELAYANCKRVL